MPAHSFSAPTRAKSIAALRSMPGVWAVLRSSSPERDHPDAVETPSPVAVIMHAHSPDPSEPERPPTKHCDQSTAKAASRTPGAPRKLSAAGDGVRRALDCGHGRRLHRDRSDAPDRARADGRRSHRHRGPRAAGHAVRRRRWPSASGEGGMVALFRFGVAVMVGLSPLEEEDLLAQLRSRVSGLRALGDDETAVLEIAPDGDEQVSRRADPASRTCRRSAFWSSPMRWPSRWRWARRARGQRACSTSSSPSQ